MGRTDAVPFTLQWAARARQLGAIVDFEPGWDTRGNGSAANYEGGLVHHTAIGSSQTNPFPGRNVLIKGRVDLKGPLCNVAGPWCTPESPRLVVISARPANHAGASGGRSMGPLPVTGSFNARVFGLEIDYSGLAPMALGQYRAALIFARAVADVLGRSIEHVRAHAETSVTGKWDPGHANGKTYDMAAFRRAAAALTPTSGDDDMYGQAERDELVVRLDEMRGELDRLIAIIPTINQVHGKLTSRYDLSGRPVEGADDMYGHVLNTEARVAALGGAPAAGGVDVDALAARLATALAGQVGTSRQDVEDAVREVLREGTGV